MLAAVAAFVPGDDDDGCICVRAGQDAGGHAAQHDGFCLDGEGAGTIERRPEEFGSDAAGSVGKIGRRLPRRGDDAEAVRILDAGRVLQPVGEDAQAVALGAGRAADEAVRQDVVFDIAKAGGGDRRGLKAG